MHKDFKQLDLFEPLLIFGTGQPDFPLSLLMFISTTYHKFVSAIPRVVSEDPGPQPLPEIRQCDFAGVKYSQKSQQRAVTPNR